MPDENVVNPQERPVSPEEQPDDEPINLVESKEPSPEEPIGVAKSAVRSASLKAFGAGAAAAAKRKQYTRPVNLPGTGAVRCRLFHSKIAPVPLEHMEEQINDWLDGEQIEIKHVGHVIGTMEGKRTEPNLIVMVWY